MHGEWASTLTFVEVPNTYIGIHLFNMYVCVGQLVTLLLIYSTEIMLEFMCEGYEL